jgi:hypothetical protein
VGKVEEAWNRAEACERHAQNTKDGKLQAKFRKLRDSWIRIGNKARLQEHLEANSERLNNERTSAG